MGNFRRKILVLSAALAVTGVFFIKIYHAQAAPSISFTTGLEAGCYRVADVIYPGFTTTDIHHLGIGYSFSTSPPPNNSGRDPNNPSTYIVGSGWFRNDIQTGEMPFSSYVSPLYVSNTFYIWLWGFDANNNVIVGPIPSRQLKIVSSSSSCSDDTTPPSVPSGFTVSGSLGANSATFQWTVPSDNSGSIVSYQMRYRAGSVASFSDDVWSSATVASGLPAPTASGTTQSYTLSGLSGNTYYSVGLKACDAAGNCSGAAVANFTTQAAGDTQAPGFVTNYRAISVYKTEVDLTWTVPTDNVGVTRYDIRYKPSSTPMTDADWASATQVTSPPSPSSPGLTQYYLLTGLTSNTSYAVGIKACDAANNCSIYLAILVSTLSSSSPDTQAPNQITNFKTGFSISTGFGLNWTAPSDNVAVSYYKLQYKVSQTIPSEAEWEGAGVIAGPAPSSVLSPGLTQSFELTGLSPSTNYAISLRACDAANNCSARATLLATTGSPPAPLPAVCSSWVGPLPGAITDLHVMTSGVTPEIMWLVPPGVSSYEIRAFSGGTLTEANWNSAILAQTSVTPPTSNTSCAVSTPNIPLTNLASGVTYSIGIRGMNGAGMAPISNIIYITPSGSTTQTSTTTTPVYTPTPTPYPVSQPVPQPAGVSLCGNVYASDNGRNEPLPGSKVVLIMGPLNRSAQSDSAGHYCFTDLPSSGGAYTIIAEAPAGRTDLSSPLTGNATLYPGGSSTHDMYLSRAYVYTQPVTPIGQVPPTPPPQSEFANLPNQEKCVRDVLGEERYRLMKKGRINPAREEMEKMGACFGFYGPIVQPVMPIQSEQAMPVGITEEKPAPRPVFSDTCEKRELPRIKTELRRFIRKLDEIEKQGSKLRKEGINIPTNFVFLITRARDIFSKIQSSQTCEEAFQYGSEMPEIMQSLQAVFESISYLNWAPKALRSYDKAVSSFLGDANNSLKRLARRKFDVSLLKERLLGKEGELKECRAKAVLELNTTDPVGFQEALRLCFELLDEAQEVRDLIKAVDRARSYLSGGVDRLIKQANKLISVLERQDKMDEAEDVKAALEELKVKRDEVLSDYFQLQKDKEELFEALSTVAGLYDALEDAMASARGISTYEEVVGRPKEVFERVELGKGALEFFSLVR